MPLGKQALGNPCGGTSGEHSSGAWQISPSRPSLCVPGISPREQGLSFLPESLYGSQQLWEALYSEPRLSHPPWVLGWSASKILRYILVWAQGLIQGQGMLETVLNPSPGKQDPAGCTPPPPPQVSPPPLFHFVLIWGWTELAPAGRGCQQAHSLPVEPSPVSRAVFIHQ